MKLKYLFFAFFSFVFSFAKAQTNLLKVELKDGSVVYHNVYGIKRVTWIPETPLGPQPMTYKIDGKEFEWVLVDSDELSPFYIMQTELPPSSTIEINGKIFGPLNKNGDVAVTKNEYVSFINEIQEHTGWKFRLPTDEEWIYAAKGGKYSEGFTYSGSEDIEDVAWYKGNSSGKIHEVAQKSPNELGLYDMSGNFGEVCFDIEIEDGVDGNIYGGNINDSAGQCTTLSFVKGNRNTGFIGNSRIRHMNAFDARIETIRLVYDVPKDN